MNLFRRIFGERDTEPAPRAADVPTSKEYVDDGSTAVAPDDKSLAAGDVPGAGVAAGNEFADALTIGPRLGEVVVGANETITIGSDHSEDAGVTPGDVGMKGSKILQNAPRGEEMASGAGEPAAEGSGDDSLVTERAAEPGGSIPAPYPNVAMAAGEEPESRSDAPDESSPDAEPAAIGPQFRKHYDMGSPYLNDPAPPHEEMSARPSDGEGDPSQPYIVGSLPNTPAPNITLKRSVTNEGQQDPVPTEEMSLNFGEIKDDEGAILQAPATDDQYNESGLDFMHRRAEDIPDTQRSGSGGYNEIRLEDSPGAEGEPGMPAASDGTSNTVFVSESIPAGDLDDGASDTIVGARPGGESLGEVVPAADLVSDPGDEPAANYYLKLEDVEGKSAGADHDDEIDVLSWSWGSTQSGTIGDVDGDSPPDSLAGEATEGELEGPVKAGYDLKINKEVAPPPDDPALTTGAGMDPDPVVERADAAAARSVPPATAEDGYLQVKLKDALVSSYQTGGSGDEPSTLADLAQEDQHTPAAGEPTTDAGFELGDLEELEEPEV